MTDVTICIPCAPHHESLLPRAVRSVENQTAPTTALTFIDTDKRGTGWARNELLKQVTTPYVGFLDADDWLEPEFVASCLPMVDPGWYAYTDWYFDDHVQQATDTPWLHEDDWHLVNVLLLMSDARRIGMFDHTLSCMEDTDWFLKAALYDICGRRVAQPLVHYTAAGSRSAQALRRGQLNSTKLRLKERYAWKMGCCGSEQTPDMLLPAGIKQDGDVLAMAKWSGNHVKSGKATGRRYPRMSYPKTTWVDPRDAERDPLSWRIVEKPVVETPPAPVAVQTNGNGDGHYVNGEGFAQAIIDAKIITPPPPVELGVVPTGYKLANPDVIDHPYIPQLAETITPDWARLVELGAARYE